jgi:hypothetical protein
MSWIRQKNISVPVLLCMATLLATLSAGVVSAGTYAWEDIRTPFKQTFRFSTAETATVQVTIPETVLGASDRVTIFYNIDWTSPRLRPYLLVNGNRQAFYFLGRFNGTVTIRSEHLVAGVNALRFADQTATGDLIFIYELRYVRP